MKQFDWDEFKKGYIMVSCETKEKAINFLEECSKNNIYFETYHNDKNYWDEFKEYTCYKIDHTTKKLNYTSLFCCYWNLNDYIILNWSDYMNNKEIKDFTKDMLEDFMVVETNEEENNRYMKIKNKLVQTKSFNNLNDYNNNLKYNTISEEDVIYDIQKIYKIKNIIGFGYMLTDDSNLELIWERKEEPIEYTLEELEQKLGQKIKIVNK